MGSKCSCKQGFQLGLVKIFPFKSFFPDTKLGLHLNIPTVSTEESSVIHVIQTQNTVPAPEDYVLGCITNSLPSQRQETTQHWRKSRKVRLEGTSGCHLGQLSAQGRTTLSNERAQHSRGKGEPKVPTYNSHEALQWHFRGTIFDGLIFHLKLHIFQEQFSLFFFFHKKFSPKITYFPVKL